MSRSLACTAVPLSTRRMQKGRCHLLTSFARTRTTGFVTIVLSALLRMKKATPYLRTKVSKTSAIHSMMTRMMASSCPPDSTSRAWMHLNLSTSVHRSTTRAQASCVVLQSSRGGAPASGIQTMKELSLPSYRCASATCQSCSPTTKASSSTPGRTVATAPTSSNDQHRCCA